MSWFIWIISKRSQGTVDANAECWVWIVVKCETVFHDSFMIVLLLYFLLTQLYENQPITLQWISMDWFLNTPTLASNEFKKITGK